MRSEAEPLYHRALAIDEKSCRPDHPADARDLNNLAGLLQATNRLTEAEPMRRRVLVILARFTRMTGHQHPKLGVGLSNYARVLRELGRTEAEIEAALKSVIADAAREPAS